LLKAHVRADDFADDDDYLMHLRDTAEEWVLNATHRTDAELREMGGGEYPKSLQHAMLLIAAHWYNQRESVSNTQMYVVPDALQALIKPYRKLSDQ
jgi:hypothetical protein